MDAPASILKADVCPSCGNEGDCSDTDFDSHQIVGYYYCYKEKCSARWRARFRLVSVEEYK